MSTTPIFTPGRFVWRELMTSDASAAEAFYTRLFGWTVKSVDMGPMGTYRLLSAGETQVGGIAQLPAGMGVPPHWVGYVSVPSVDEAAKAAEGLGGTVPVPPSDIPEIGRFAILVDPQGGSLALFRSSRGDEPVAQGAPAPGTFCWESLNTADVEGAFKFYGKVCGWRRESFMPDMPVFTVGPTPADQVANVVAAPPGVPTHWVSYVVIQSLAKSRALARELGAKVLLEQMDVPTVGSFAVIQDPQGAILCSFQPESARD